MKKIANILIIAAFFFLCSCQDPSCKTKSSSSAAVKIEKTEKKEVRSRRW